MGRPDSPGAGGASETPEQLRQTNAGRLECRVHLALILAACFTVGLVVTKLLLMSGVGTMWIRYALALCAAYVAFLASVKVWLLYMGYDRRIWPSRRSSLTDGSDISGIGYSGGGGSGGGTGVSLPSFRGGGGGSGGGGASASFGDDSLESGGSSQSSILPFSSGGHSSSGGGGGFDLGDDGWVLIALIALLAAVFGGVVWIIYAAPTILADAAFAGMLSAGLARSTRHIASGGWVASVVGHTWFAFAVVCVLAIVFAMVAQHRFPEAQTLVDVIRRL